MGMLVLTRRLGEKLMIGEDVSIQIMSIERGNIVKVGINAPKHVPVHREEIYNDMMAQRGKVFSNDDLKSMNETKELTGDNIGNRISDTQPSQVVKKRKFFEMIKK